MTEDIEHIKARIERIEQAVVAQAGAGHELSNRYAELDALYRRQAVHLESLRGRVAELENVLKALESGYDVIPIK